MNTVKQAASKIGISRAKLYQLAQRHEIAHFRIGGKILFSDADIQEFLSKNRVEAAEPLAAPLPTQKKTPLKLRHINLSPS